MTREAIVFGAAGQLGVELVRVLTEKGYEVAAWDRPEVDITDPAAVEKIMAGHDPAWVFNSAAYNQVDVAEHEPLAAFQVNALAVRNLAVICRQLDVPLIHFSTDYVFDGTLGRSYVEEDATHPLGAYGVSKLAGELYAQAYLDRVLIVRTSGVFGPGGLNTARGNFVESMLRVASAGQPVRVVEDYVASPAFAPALAERTVDLAFQGAAGVFHIGGGVPISWFRFAQLIFEAAGVKTALQPTDAREYRTVARRPQFSALSNAKMERSAVAPMPPMEQALREYFSARSRIRA